jgi:hypothetical protein
MAEVDFIEAIVEQLLAELKRAPLPRDRRRRPIGEA